MRTINKLAKSADKISRMLLSNFKLYLAAFVLLAPVNAIAEDPPECALLSEKDSAFVSAGREYDSAKADYDALTAEQKNSPTSQQITIKSRWERAERARRSAERSLETAQDNCNRAKDRKAVAEKTCREKEKLNHNDPKTGQPVVLYRWVETAGKGECVEYAKGDKSITEKECNQADIFEGNTLKGQNCRAATTTIKEVSDRNKAITNTTVALGSTYAQVAAMSSTGKQQDAQESQRKVLQGLAISKLISGGSALTGAAQLKSAAAGAEEGNQAMSGAYVNINKECDSRIASFNNDRRACFFAVAPNHQVPASKMEYANFERLTGGAGQSADAAKAANAAAITSGISGLADTVVGLQAMQMANQAKNQANNMGSMPTPRVIGLAPFTGASQAPNLGGFGTGTKPTDFGNPGADGATLGNTNGGNIRGGMKAGKPFGGSNAFVSAKSGVSAAGGGSGGGGRGGGSGASKGGGKGGKSLGNTGVGEYSLGGGGPAYKGGGKEEAAGNNAFADALAKLFPQGADGKPIVDGRTLASEEDPDAVTGEEGEGSNVYASELTIFEQVNAKYRQLSGSGTI
jgi:hypothetical protein